MSESQLSQSRMSQNLRLCKVCGKYYTTFYQQGYHPCLLANSCRCGPNTARIGNCKNTCVEKNPAKQIISKKWDYLFCVDNNSKQKYSNYFGNWPILKNIDFMSLSIYILKYCFYWFWKVLRRYWRYQRLFSGSS